MGDVNTIRFLGDAELYERGDGSEGAWDDALDHHGLFVWGVSNMEPGDRIALACGGRTILVDHADLLAAVQAAHQTAPEPD